MKHIHGEFLDMQDKTGLFEISLLLSFPSNFLSLAFSVLISFFFYYYFFISLVKGRDQNHDGRV